MWVYWGNWTNTSATLHDHKSRDKNWFVQVTSSTFSVNVRLKRIDIAIALVKYIIYHTGISIWIIVSSSIRLLCTVVKIIWIHCVCFIPVVSMHRCDQYILAQLTDPCVRFNIKTTLSRHMHSITKHRHPKGMTYHYDVNYARCLLGNKDHISQDTLYISGSPIENQWGSRKYPR